MESRTTTLWKAKDIDFRHYQTVMVLAPATDLDTTLSTFMESHLAGDLVDLGYRVKAAREEDGSDKLRNMSFKSVNELLKNGDVEALFTIVLLKKETGTMYVPGAFYLMPSSLYPDSYYDFDKGSRDMRYDPGYYASYADYLWICSVYDINSGKLVYSVQSYSDNVVNTQLMAHEYGQRIVRNMQRHNIIRKSNKMKAF